MKKCNTSFVLSLLANIGFILFIIADFSFSFGKVYWLQWGLLLNFLIMVYFISLMFTFYEYVKGVCNNSFIGGLTLNILGFILYLMYTSSLQGLNNLDGQTLIIVNKNYTYHIRSQANTTEEEKMPLFRQEKFLHNKYIASICIICRFLAVILACIAIILLTFTLSWNFLHSSIL